MGIHGGLVPESLKAGSSPGSVLLGDGELPGGRQPDFLFSRLPLPSLCCCILVRLTNLLYGACGFFV